MKTIKKAILISMITGALSNTIMAQPRRVDVHPEPKKTNQNSSSNGQENELWWISGGFGWGNPVAPPPPMYASYGSGNYGYYNSGYYGGGYNVAYYRRLARKTLRRSAQVIHAAIQQNYWTGNFNPVLSDAVNHQQRAKFLFYNGDFIGAINHSRRARFLASKAYQMDSQWSYWYDDDFGYYGNDPYAGNTGGGPGYGNGWDDWDYRKSPQPGSQNKTETEDDVYKRKSSAQSDPNLMKESQLENLDQSVEKRKLSKDELKKITLDDLDVNEKFQ